MTNFVEEKGDLFQQAMCHVLSYITSYILPVSMSQCNAVFQLSQGKNRVGGFFLVGWGFFLVAWLDYFFLEKKLLWIQNNYKILTVS